ncbi:hypothetical protein [Halorubrum sp. DTA98]|uniref:hypothetical protein n=1 Tax=Halorubrum sp. DTA98 TaxID=3402163 RepID=UPI003AAFEC25
MYDEDIESISFGYLQEASYGTSILLIFLLICALPMLFATIADGQILSYVLFGVLGWSFYYGQRYAKIRLENPDTELNDEETTMSEAIGSVLYFNSILFIGVILATASAEVWNPFAGLLIALVYPVYDTEIATYKLPLSIGGICAIVFGVFVWITGRISNFAESLDTPEMKFGDYLTNFPISYLSRLRARPR